MSNYDPAEEKCDLDKAIALGKLFFEALKSLKTDSQRITALAEIEDHMCLKCGELTETHCWCDHDSRPDFD